MTTLRHLVVALAGLVLTTGGLPGQVTIPFRTESSRFIVDVVHDATGDTLHLLLDTGASRTAITESVADALALLGGRRSTAHTPTGVIQTQVKLLTGISAAGAALPDLAVGVASGPDTAAYSGYDGLLGADVLRRFDVLISPAAGQVLLFDEGTGPGDWEARLGPPLDLVESALPILLHPVVVNGVEVTAFLDTGARSNALNSAGAARTGVRADPRTHRPGTPGPAARLDSVRIGTLTLTQLPAWVVDLAIPGALPLSASDPWMLLSIRVIEDCPVFISDARKIVRYCAQASGTGPLTPLQPHQVVALPALAQGEEALLDRVYATRAARERE